MKISWTVALCLVALGAVAVAGDDSGAAAPAAPAVEVPQALLETEAKGKAESQFISPFISPYTLNPLLYFGAGFATPFILGGMSAGAATPMAMTGTMPQPMQLPMMANIGVDAKAKTATEASSKSGFTGYGMYPYGGFGYGYPYGGFGYGYGGYGGFGYPYGYGFY